MTDESADYQQWDRAIARRSCKGMCIWQDGTGTMAKLKDGNQKHLDELLDSDNNSIHCAARRQVSRPSLLVSSRLPYEKLSLHFCTVRLLRNLR